MQADSVAATVEMVDQASGPSQVRSRLTGVVAVLTAANVLTAALGFITGPLLARALGAAGRGDLAAVQVPLQLAPAILGLGISGFAYRALPRGRSIQEVIGSLGLPLVLMGLVGVAGAVPAADALAGGRETVRTFLIVSFVAMPILLVGALVLSSLSALERWRSVVATNMIPFLVPFVAIVAFYATGHLTVAIAAAATVAGSLLAFIPGLPLLASARRPVFRRALAREGISFGLKGWVGGLAQLANGRLDQVLMITVVAPRELGLYAVATTISGASFVAIGALTPPLTARIAAGEKHLLPQAIRVTLAATTGFNLMLALATPTLLSVLFGPAFHGAVTMAIVLLVASISQAGASVLSSAFLADGAPLIPSVGEGIALVITVVGLVTLLRPLGGVGAAIVSFAAYSASFLFQLVMTRRRTGLPLSVLVVPTRADVIWARDRVKGLLLRLKASET